MLVMSQCSRDTSTAKSAIARAPTVPASWSRHGAIASSARARRSSEQGRLDTEDLLHRPGPRPVTHPHQWRGRSQPVRHQRFDNLPVAQVRARANWAQFVDDPGHMQPAQKLGSDGQSA
jgi:hypothetical protein